MAKGWYVVQTYSGHEKKVEKFINMLINDGSLSEHVFNVKVPSEEVVEMKKGKKTISNKKFLPGYILLEMDLPDRGWKAIVSQIRRIDSVAGFVGSTGGIKPQPLSGDEARAIFQKAGEIKSDKSYRPKQEFAVGESVRIIEGPFESFTGKIEDVNLEKSKLKVLVGIFGRSTALEVEFFQVEKV